MNTALYSVLGIAITALLAFFGVWVNARANVEVARTNAEAARASIEVARINAGATVAVARINAGTKPPPAPVTMAVRSAKS